MNAPHASRTAGWPWIGLSLIVALLVNLAPWSHSPVTPDVLALVLVFWTIDQPRRALLSVAFLLGLVMDVHHGTVLGQHALLHTVAVLLALRLQRRISWFQTPGRMLHVLGLLLLAQAILAAARWLVGLPWLGPEQFLTWLSTVLLWPLIDLLLLSGQRPRPATQHPGGPPVPPTMSSRPGPAQRREPSLAAHPAFPRQDRPH